MEWKSGPWFSFWNDSNAGELFLTINAKLLNLTRSLEAGHLLSSTQIPLPAKGQIIPQVFPTSSTSHISFGKISRRSARKYEFLTIVSNLLLQAIKKTDTSITCETVGDFIKISQKDSWELMVNVRKGTIEGWKVSSFLFYFLIAKL